ncbi:MAG: tRNA-dihydrouridine synthase, partial [Pseudomonadota bacterium]
SSCDVPVTLKMRLGWSRESMNAPELAKRAVDAGVQMITVHGRTRDQFYEGTADWDTIASVRDAIGPSVPLVVNGDIRCAKSAQTAMAQAKADAVMVGRSACGRPWVPAEIAGSAKHVPVPDEYALYVQDHYEAILEHYGGFTGVRNARKHLGWYLDTLAPLATSDQRAALLREKDPDRVKTLIGEAFGRSATRAAERKAA